MPVVAELVEHVIGVDTHADTHTAALVRTGNGALLATITVTADGDGYTQLVELAEFHGGLRAWAVEGAGGYGAGQSVWCGRARSSSRPRPSCGPGPDSVRSVVSGTP